MLLTELYYRIANRLCLNEAEREDLAKTFPDPLAAGEVDKWDGNDVCDHFGRERRHNRSIINVSISLYKKQNERVEYSKLDGE